MARRFCGLNQITHYEKNYTDGRSRNDGGVFFAQYFESGRCAGSIGPGNCPCRTPELVDGYEDGTAAAGAGSGYRLIRGWHRRKRPFREERAQGRQPQLPVCGRGGFAQSPGRYLLPDFQQGRPVLQIPLHHPGPGAGECRPEELYHGRYDLSYHAGPLCIGLPGQ